VFDSHIPCRFPAVSKLFPCLFHAVPLPFPRHSPAVYKQFPCRSPAMPRICFSENDLSRPWQSRGRIAAGWRHGNSMGTTLYVWISIDRPETAFWRPTSVRLIPATTRSSRQFVIRSIPISDKGDQCEMNQRLWWTRRSLLFWCKDMSACVIYSTKIVITI
jgi:hypothetical protein